MTAQQASTIANLQKPSQLLTIENNVKKDEMIDILAEFYEDMEDADNEIWDDIDLVWEDVDGMTEHMMHIVKMQSRINPRKYTGIST